MNRNFNLNFSLGNLLFGIFLFCAILTSSRSLGLAGLIPASFATSVYLVRKGTSNSNFTLNRKYRANIFLAFTFLFSFFFSMFAIPVLRNMEPMNFGGLDLLLLLIRFSANSFHSSALSFLNGEIGKCCNELANAVFAASALSSIGAVLAVVFGVNTASHNGFVSKAATTMLLLSASVTWLLPAELGMSALRIGFFLWAIPLNYFALTLSFSQRLYLIALLVLMFEASFVGVSSAHPK